MFQGEWGWEVVDVAQAGSKHENNPDIFFYNKNKHVRIAFQIQQIIFKHLFLIKFPFLLFLDISSSTKPFFFVL